MQTFVAEAPKIYNELMKSEAAAADEVYASVKDFDKMKYFAKMFYVFKYQSAAREILAEDPSKGHIFDVCHSFEPTPFTLHGTTDNQMPQFVKLWIRGFVKYGESCNCETCKQFKKQQQ